MKSTAKQLFPGITIYKEKTVVLKNRFSGESIEVTGEEASVYDYIIGCEMFGHYNEMSKGLDWFARKNPKAYMVLLD